MSNAVSTISSKWQITIPEEIRSRFAVNIGQRIAWQVQGDSLVGHRVRKAGQLAGALRPIRKGRARDASKTAFAEAASRRDARLSKRK